jgi:hypothetical protein
MSRVKKAPARDGRTAKASVRRGTMILESDRPRRIDVRVAPPKQAERRHARPGSGIKHARAAMLPKPR